MSNSQLQELINLLKSSGTVAWQAAQQQVRADLIANLALAALWIALAFVALKMAKRVFAYTASIRSAKDLDEYDKEDHIIVGWLILISCSIGAVTFLILSASCLLTSWYDYASPQYAAIHQLVNLVPGQ